MSADPVVVRSLGEAPLVLGDAVVVICGPIRAGNRRARRLAVTAAVAGCRVVWIDAFDERGSFRGDLPVDEGCAGGSIEWVSAESDLDTSLRGGRLWRLSDRISGWREMPMVRRRSVLRGLLGGVVSKLRRLRRLSRGGALWRCVRDQIDADGGTPAAIIHTDDVAVTAAWHLARRYPGVPAANEIPPGVLDRRADV